MVESQFGYCEICGSHNKLSSVFYDFPIACECCVAKTHHHRVNFCEYCIPVKPKAIRLTIKVDKLLDPIHEGLFKKVP